MKARARCAVIAFPIERVRPAGEGVRGDGRGEVVIFTGVRVERLCDDVKPLPAPLPRRQTQRAHRPRSS